MSRPGMSFVRRQVSKFLGAGGGDEQGDAALLGRFVHLRDEAAFAALLDRHGPLVLGVCRQVLGNTPDAEDAFQATFIILARKGGSIRQLTSLAGWLHRVAANVARTAARRAARRRRHEQDAATRGQLDRTEALMDTEWHPMLHAEVDRLPGKFRLPIVLCYLQGKTHDEAARELGWPVGTVRSSLARGRDVLRQRLTRRGLTVAAGAVATAATAGPLPAVPPALVQLTMQAALAGVAAPPAVAGLVEATLATLTVVKFRSAMLVGMALLLCGLGAGWLSWQVWRADGDTPQAFRAEAVAEPPPEPAPARRDLHGDPLPAGALLRLGSIRLRQPGELAVARFAPDNATLATGDHDGTVRLWDVSSGKQLAARPGHEGVIADLAFSPDGRWLASAGGDGVRLWKPATGKGRRAATGGGGTVCGLRFTSEGAALVAVTTTGDVIRWDAGTGKVLGHFPGDGSSIGVVAFAPDGRTAALGMTDARAGTKGQVAATAKAEADTPTGKLDIVLKDLATGKEVRRWPAHAWMPRQLAFALDGRVLVSGSSSTQDSFLRFWDTATGKEVAGFPEIDCFYGSFTVTPDGQTLVAADSRGRDGMVLCDLAGKKLLRAFNAPGRFLSAMSVSPDGNRVVVLADRSRAVHVYSLATGEAMSRLGHHGAVARVAFSPDGKRLATVSECRPMAPAGEDASLRLWDVATGRPLARVSESVEFPPFLAFATDSKLVATADPAGMWDLGTGQRVRPFQLWPKDVNERVKLPRNRWPEVVIYSPDLKKMAIRFHNGGMEVRDAASGETLCKYGADIQGEINSWVTLAFSPDGRFVASGEAGGQVLMWDTIRNHMFGPLEAHDLWVSSVAFSPDGRTLVTTGGEGQIRLWETATGQPRCDIGPGPEEARAHWKNGGQRSPGDRFDRYRGTAFAPDGRTLASAGNDGTVAMWDPLTGKELANFRGHLGAVRWVAYAPDGRGLASASEDTTALVWDVADTKPDAGPSGGPREELWAALAGNDAPAAYRAIGDLVRAPAAAVSWLAERLRPVPAPDAARMAKLIAGLRDPDFLTRDRAAQELEAVGETAAPFLREVLKTTEPLDIRQRLERILEKAASPRSAEALRATRAVEILEKIGTPEAVRLLTTLAGGAGGARLTIEAKVSLARVASWSVKP